MRSTAIEGSTWFILGLIAAPTIVALPVNPFDYVSRSVDRDGSDAPRARRRDDATDRVEKRRAFDALKAPRGRPAVRAR